ncbi:MULTISPECIES: hypothetical protein [Shewanella]|uniref:Uncharacterized protein n=1 Tax=Shewanella holmiensis TaxID=2952222 RepID=A0A9X2WQA3_9GAMM|nr:MULTISPECIES: hypothetical protein [Shewanella]MCT7943316.1 hypothetical protein [Shewanella holmiensis]MDP5148301.1 hypothetical protein [Shewanella sp. ULN5]
MSLFRSIGRQWDKSAFADKIAKKLQSHREICALFVGATSIETVANLVSAFTYDEAQKPLEQNLNDAMMLQLLFDSFRQLIGKQIDLGELSQAEHLIVQATKVYADIVELEEDSEALTRVVEQVRSLSKQLEALQKYQRNQHRSMVVNRY